MDRAGKKGRERLRGVSSDSKYGRSVDTEMEKQRAVQTSGGESREEIGKQKSRERESETGEREKEATYPQIHHHLEREIKGSLSANRSLLTSPRVSGRKTETSG